jgi:hypothetical protein
MSEIIIDTHSMMFLHQEIANAIADGMSQFLFLENGKRYQLELFNGGSFRMTGTVKSYIGSWLCFVRDNTVEAYWYNSAYIFSINGPLPDYPSTCPACGRQWDMQKHNACECGAQVRKQ